MSLTENKFNKGHKMSEWDFPIGLLFGCIIALFVGFITDGSADDYWKKQAAKQGYAEFYINETQEKDWRWLEKDEVKVDKVEKE